MAEAGGRAGASAGRDDGPIAAEIVDEAVAWYVRLAGRTGATGEAGLQARFEHWLAADADHGRVWRRLQGIGDQVRASGSQVAPSLARSTLTLASQAAARSRSRRRGLKALAFAGLGVGLGGGLVALVQRELAWRSGLGIALAGIRTATGERRQLDLADGSRLLLNTATAVDLAFDAGRRVITLHAGEILVATAASLAAGGEGPGSSAGSGSGMGSGMGPEMGPGMGPGLGPPLEVRTADGRVLPLGTRFQVRRDPFVLSRTGGLTEVTVTEGRVALLPAAGAEPGRQVIEAGQRARFTRDRVTLTEAAGQSGLAWADGFLTAEGMPVDRFIAEVARYRRGRLVASPELASLRITGAWPLDAAPGEDATDRILASVERQLPIRIEKTSRYWVTVSPR